MASLRILHARVSNRPEYSYFNDIESLGRLARAADEFSVPDEARALYRGGRRLS